MLGGFIREFGTPKIQIRRQADLFLALSRAIVYQQLSGKAAGTIYDRFSALFSCGEPNATDLMDIKHQELRSVGLSNNKALSVADLAEKCCSGELPSRRKMLAMEDQEIIDNLVAVRGIGPWTVQMFLMFNLGRPDVLPATDLGVQKGFQALYGHEELPPPQALLDHGECWRPYRSVASWYLWRAADTVLMGD